MAAIVAGFLLVCFALLPGPLLSWPGLIPFFCLGANQNVRGNGLVVNSVFLVQLRKMFAADFLGSVRI
jgi:hypothetical protein